MRHSGSAVASTSTCGSQPSGDIRDLTASGAIDEEEL
jgi:hypothetical protein